MGILIYIIFFILCIASMVPINIIIDLKEILFVVLNLFLFMLATKTVKDFYKIIKYYFKSNIDINIKKSLVILRKYKIVTLIIGVIGSLTKYIAAGNYITETEVYAFSIHAKFRPILYALVVIVLILYPLEIYLEKYQDNK